MGVIEMIELASVRFVPTYGALELKLRDLVARNYLDKLTHLIGNKMTSWA
jgi:hypothetical protein